MSPEGTKAVGMPLQRQARRGVRDPIQADLDPVLVHLVQRDGDRVVGRQILGHVLEHVLGRELHLLLELRSLVCFLMKSYCANPRAGSRSSVSTIGRPVGIPIAGTSACDGNGTNCSAADGQGN